MSDTPAKMLAKIELVQENGDVFRDEKFARITLYQGNKTVAIVQPTYRRYSSDEAAMRWATGMCKKIGVQVVPTLRNGQRRRDL